MKRAFAATLFILTATAFAYAQDARRVASASSPKPAKSSAVRTPREKAVTADEHD